MTTIRLLYTSEQHRCFLNEWHCQSTAESWWHWERPLISVLQLRRLYCLSSSQAWWSLRKQGTRKKDSLNSRSCNLKIMKVCIKYTETSSHGCGGINFPYCCIFYTLRVLAYLPVSSGTPITSVDIWGMERKERRLSSIWMHSLRSIMDWSSKACFCLPRWSAGSDLMRCLKVFAEVSFAAFTELLREKDEKKKSSLPPGR